MHDMHDDYHATLNRFSYWAQDDDGYTWIGERDLLTTVWDDYMTARREAAKALDRNDFAPV